MTDKLTKKELKTLQDALGKQGLTMEEHESAQSSTKTLEFLHVDCFMLDGSVQQEPNRGWHIGYGVEYNGVGISADGGEASSTSSEAAQLSEEDRSEHDDESSGFDSDPPTDDENSSENQLQSRRESDDVSDSGQLLYGLDTQFYVDKGLTPRNVTVYDREYRGIFVTGDLVTTNRFDVVKSSEPDDEFHEGYQMIGEGNACVTSHDEDSEAEEMTPKEDVTTSAGLWCNFVISVKDLERVEKPEKLEIPEEKLKTIPLDSEKLAQISAAMANFKLPTPPGWEGVSDSKILEFIRQRI